MSVAHYLLQVDSPAGECKCIGADADFKRVSGPTRQAPCQVRPGITDKDFRGGLRQAFADILQPHAGIDTHKHHA